MSLCGFWPHRESIWNVCACVSAWNEISFSQKGMRQIDEIDKFLKQKNQNTNRSVGIAYIICHLFLFSAKFIITSSNSKVLTKFFHSSWLQSYLCTNKIQQQNLNICTIQKSHMFCLFAYNQFKWWHWIIFIRSIDWRAWRPLYDAYSHFHENPKLRSTYHL